MTLICSFTQLNKKSIWALNAMDDQQKYTTQTAMDIELTLAQRRDDSSANISLYVTKSR